MPRRLLLALLTMLLVAAMGGPAGSGALADETGFRIVLDQPEFAADTVAGSLQAVPSGAQSATVTLTLASGQTRSVQTNAAQKWAFTFSNVYMGVPWVQLAVVTSSGEGTSLANIWGVEQAANYTAEHTPKGPVYTYPPDFPGRWYGYYGEAYGYPYAYAYGLPAYPGYPYYYPGAPIVAGYPYAYGFPFVYGGYGSSGYGYSYPFGPSNWNVYPAGSGSYPYGQGYYSCC